MRIDIDFCQDRVAVHNRHHDFAAHVDAACEIVVLGVDIFDHEGGPSFRSLTTDSGTKGNAKMLGRGSLVRSQHQHGFPRDSQIETHPVVVGNLRPKQVTDEL